MEYNRGREPVAWLLRTADASAASAEGLTDEAGLITLGNFTVNGPGGLYTLMPSAGGVDSLQAKMWSGLPTDDIS